MGSRGVVILGGAHGSLALARSVGALGAPVWSISNDSALPAWSRYVRKRLNWPGPDASDAVDFLLEAAEEHGLTGFLLIPAGDGEVRMVSQARARLAEAYEIFLPEWDRLRWVCEKPLLYRRAEELGLAIPKTYRIASQEEASSLEPLFPIILKPNMGGGDSEFVKAKVIRVEDRSSFLAVYRDASREIGSANVVVQEMVPGGGESQLSYGALWHDGAPVAELTARRTRQYPVEFGYTSTFVEIVDQPEAVEIARKLLGSIAFSGLVEIELKRDRRDGSLKLLDVNPRPWAWFGLCRAAGLDLGKILWAAGNNGSGQIAKAETGAAWMYLVRDGIAALSLLSSGGLGLGDYLRSFRSVRSWATFSTDDPLPGLIDLPLTFWRVIDRRMLRR